MLTIQEGLLLGTTPRERFLSARALGLQGVEIDAASLADGDDAIFAYAAAVDASGIPVTSLVLRDTVGLLSLNPAVRDPQIDRVRQALTDAADLGAQHVTVVPQPAHAPQEVTAEQEYELMIWFVRVVNDLAGAMGVKLLLLPLELTQARVLNTLQQGYAALEAMRFHPSVGLSADLYSLHNGDPLENFSGIVPMLAQVYVHDPSTRAITAQPVDFTLIQRLVAAGFQRHWTISAGRPFHHAPNAAEPATLEAFVAALRAQGIGQLTP